MNVTPEVWDSVKWAAMLLVAILGYFLRDAHRDFKDGLERKADKKVIDDAFAVYRADMRSIEDRHKEETARLERQYEVRFAGVVAQFSERLNSVERAVSDRIGTMERGVSEKMDLILSVVDRRKE